MLVFIVAVVGLYVFVGNTGITSFGHVSFMAIGGIRRAILALPEISKKLLLARHPRCGQVGRGGPDGRGARRRGGRRRVLAAVRRAADAHDRHRRRDLVARRAHHLNVVFRETDAWTRGEKVAQRDPARHDDGECRALGGRRGPRRVRLPALALGRAGEASREDELAAGRRASIGPAADGPLI